jgi:hypothetical protein
MRIPSIDNSVPVKWVHVAGGLWYPQKLSYCMLNRIQHFEILFGSESNKNSEAPDLFLNSFKWIRGSGSGSDHQKRYRDPELCF